MLAKSLLLVFFALSLSVNAAAAPPASPDADENESEEIDSIQVTATRTKGLVRDEPIRVEVVPTEEILPLQSDLMQGKDTAYLRALDWIRTCTGCK